MVSYYMYEKRELLVKKYIKYIAIILLIIVCVVVFTIIVNTKTKKENVDDEKFKIVTSFYPIYIMTANIVEDVNDIELINMTDVNTGCIHNYTLTTADMKKIEDANVFIENGLGLESFIDKVTTSNKKIQIIDSSQNISNLIEEDDELNPHIWTSISNCILQVENITNGLSKENPENAEKYQENAKKYIEKLNNLKEKYEEELQKINGESAVCLNESFEYFGKDLGLKLTSVHTSHEESSLSAEKLKSIINTVKQNNTKIIIVDLNDDLKNAQTIANETGAQIYILDSASTGSLDKDSYINSMNSNLEKLK